MTVTGIKYQERKRAARSCYLIPVTSGHRPLLAGKLARGHADKGDLSAGAPPPPVANTPTHTVFFMDTSVSLIPTRSFRPSIYNWRNGSMADNFQPRGRSALGAVFLRCYRGRSSVRTNSECHARGCRLRQKTWIPRQKFSRIMTPPAAQSCLPAEMAVT